MPADIKAIIKINDQEIKETYITSDFLEKHDFAKYSESFEVIEYHNKVVGFVHLKKNTPDENEILAIAIDNEYQRKGFAREYMNYIARTLWSDSAYKTIFLEVYENIGCEPYRKRVRYYANGHDAICMKMEIKTEK